MTQANMCLGHVRQLRSIALGAIVFICFAEISTVTALERDDLPPFTAEGVISTKAFRPLASNYFGRIDGRVWFCYSNRTWHVQFAPEHTSPIPISKGAEAVEDWKTIPGGTRKIVIFINSTNSAGSNGVPIRPFAEATTNVFPIASKKGLFLPWLSLCPYPELPVIDHNSIAFNFQPRFSRHPKNRGTYRAVYLEPRNAHLAQLDITNNGSAFAADGSSFEYQPPYNTGFREHAYRVLATTNYQGTTFPIHTVLYGFSPLPNGKSPEDLYNSTITDLRIEKYDGSCSISPLAAVPSLLVALDYRLGTNDVHANYDVVNDQWLPVANERLQQLTKLVERTAQRSSVTRNHQGSRFIVIGVFILLVIMPAILFAHRTSTKKHE